MVKYWNSVDEDLELDMDVLDDLAGEAAEVCTTALHSCIAHAHCS